MADNDDTQPIAPHRDLEPPEPPADADITSDGPGTPPITDADIAETVINVDLGDGSETKSFTVPTKWVDGMGEVPVALQVPTEEEIAAARTILEEPPDEVMFVGSDATIEVWRRPEPAGKLAEASLVDADKAIQLEFDRRVAQGDQAGACDMLLDHLLWTEATRVAAERGSVTPAFGLGEPPLYEVAAHAVQRETALQSAEMYRRSMERERTP